METDQLRAYIDQLVALGHATLALHREGRALPAELARAADGLLALELALGGGQPEATDDAPSIVLLDDAGDLAPFFVAASGDGEATIDDRSAELPLWVAPSEIVLDLDEGAGGGPAIIAAPPDALPPLVVEVERPTAETAADDWPSWANLPAPTETPSPAGAALRFCINCGEELRSGRRFCHRCGTPVADEDVLPLPPGAPVAVAATEPPPTSPFEPQPAAEPRSSATPLSEWPTRAYKFPDAPPAETNARFCNNCGMSVAAGVAVCPECGSRDIG